MQDSDDEDEGSDSDEPALGSSDEGSGSEDEEGSAAPPLLPPVMVHPGGLEVFSPDKGG